MGVGQADRAICLPQPPLPAKLKPVLSTSGRSDPGAHATATTRSSAREELLKQAGADQIIIDAGSVASQAQVRPYTCSCVCM